ncbi:MAG: SPOR domain-containing protein [Longimicrobiales bacterium]|nr:SPOR domain-containing protein [Longimicrobiales bacterium]
MRAPRRPTSIFASLHRGLLLAIAATTLAAAGASEPLSAQSGLEEVERLTRLGRTEEAREALSRWWDGDRESASRRELQRGLWLRGRLTVDPMQAELDFQRLVVLYPTGDFTADALLRLAQAAWAMGDEASARRHFETLERNHPRSEALERGRAWMADAGPVPPPAEVESRTAEVSGRPSGAAGERRSPQTRDTPDRRAAAANWLYSVQLGAFAEVDRATSVYESARGEGVDARMVRVQGSPFTHVRVGRFAQRADAVELPDGDCQLRAYSPSSARRSR